MRLVWTRQEQAEPHGINEWLQERRPGGVRYQKVLALIRLPADEGGGFETRACYEAPQGAPTPVIVGKRRGRLPLRQACCFERSCGLEEHLPPSGAGASRVEVNPSAATAGTK